MMHAVRCTPNSASVSIQVACSSARSNAHAPHLAAQHRDQCVHFQIALRGSAFVRPDSHPTRHGSAAHRERRRECLRSHPAAVRETSAAAEIRAGFAPQAIFRPEAHPENALVQGDRAIGLTMTDRPPNSAPEPGRICTVVTPPASAREKAGSPGRTAFSIQVSATFGSLSSSTSEMFDSARSAAIDKCRNGYECR